MAAPVSLNVYSVNLRMHVCVMLKRCFADEMNAHIAGAARKCPVNRMRCKPWTKFTACSATCDGVMVRSLDKREDAR